MTPALFEIERKQIKGLLEKLQISRSATILDLGCSDLKPYSYVLLEYFDNYIGADIDVQMLERAKKKKTSNISHVQFAVCNAESLPFPDQHFDLVVFNNALAYTNKPIALAELKRVLKPGGVCISFFNNTIGYSIHKLIHPIKPLMIEWGHSFVVVINTLLFWLCRKKIFRTTFNTFREYKKLLGDLDVNVEHLALEKHTHPFGIINFMFIKRLG